MTDNVKDIQTPSGLPQGGSSEPSRAPRGKGGWAGKVLKIVVPLAVSVGLCVGLFRDIDFNEMMRIIREECDFRIILAMTLFGLVPVLVRACRWGIQLRAIDVRPPLRILFYSICGTYAVNIVFPRLGEVWRSGYIAYRQDAPFPEVFGSMIADRLADTVVVALLTLITFVAASSPFIKFMETYPQAYEAIEGILTSPLVWAAALSGLVGVWLLFRYSKNRFVNRIRNILKGIWEGFAAIARMDGKGRWLLLTAALWSCYFLQLYIAFYAFPMTRQILADNGIIVVVICYMLTTISMAIPSNGGIGPYQTAMLFGLQLFAPPAVAAGLDPAVVQAFRTAGAAFGNTVIAAQTLLWIVAGIVVFILMAADKRRHASPRA